ncbi:FTR1 family protein [Paenibacillus sp. sptzw28]|uniref:FTR1 family iron permease n=1 Tax=Paenibacillus sp. sptzw28 TaxID=715179 RepID=UPI001C6EAF48|nr:FTR1 family protein [Paenibacillus sp. sptzw28]QYR21193.1 FTR1 family protein [Paenibacillus sp. sptzw28]
MMVLLVVALLVWQGITADGAPDPSKSNLTPTAATLDTAILIFREGLEAILVLMAITAGLIRSKRDSWKPIFVGSGISVLISLHNRKRRQITDSPNDATAVSSYWSLVVIGLTSVYREGFEIVLFLQNLRLHAGNHVILIGASIGLFFTAIVGVLTFVAHQKLPYKKMLILTGVMLTVVLFVMVGETVQEMQLAGWVPTTTIHVNIPAWAGVWFCIFPTVETLASQYVAMMFVIGSYAYLQYVRVWRPRMSDRLNSDSAS